MRLILKQGREASLRRHHPWIFSGAVAKLVGTAQAGATVRVETAAGDAIALAALSPQSQIRARVWTFDPNAAVDRDFFAQKIDAALQRREAYRRHPERNAWRLIHGESDGLPGLIVDCYDDFLVCQFLFTGVEYHKAALVDCLRAAIPCRGIYERSDASVREKEGLAPKKGVLWGKAPPPGIVISEPSGRYRVDIANGHKTGFYLDQASNREQLKALADGKTVLNCFAYTGGFGVAALNGGARNVLNVDSSAAALAAAAENFTLNGFDAGRWENREGNAFEVLRDLQRQQHHFDVVVLDPPKFADNKAQIAKAARAYKDIA